MFKRKFIIGAVLFASISGAVFFVLTLPQVISPDELPDHTPDLSNGETLFWAGGCSSCHASPDPDISDPLKLVGGLALDTPFGTFIVPNISPHKEYGIGLWSQSDFVTGMVKGVSPDKRHYYPSFPYTSYQNINYTDLIDLKAFIDSLPPEDNQVGGHDMKFPFNLRRGLGLWKRVFLRKSATPKVDEPIDSVEPGPVERGRYLVQGPAHCGACHTPRNIFGAEDNSRFLAGAISPEKTGDGKPGRIPNITPHPDGIGDWTEKDIVYSLETGLTPEYDSFGGSMVEVQENMARLSADDRIAIAAYLKSIPAFADAFADKGNAESAEE